MELPLSLFDRTISRPHPRAVLVSLAVILLSLPFIFAALDGIQLEIIRSGLWRNLLVQPVVIIYVLTIAPLLSRMGENVVTSFRPLVDLDEQSYYQLLAQASTISLALALAFMGGLLLSLIFSAQAESYLVVEFWVS